MSQAWRKMAQPVIDRSDRELNAIFVEETLTRTRAIPDGVVASTSPSAMLEQIRDGWNTYIFPDNTSAATVHHPLGWSYLHTGIGYNAGRWATMTIDERRDLLANLTGVSTFTFADLGHYIEAIWSLGPRSRLTSGALAPMVDRVDEATMDITRFLLALNSTPEVPEVLYAVGGLVPAAISRTCRGPS